ncbi:hypothetical protein A671_04485 [Salmonella enterica subsp. enterica serovar Dublin str. DG22]|nr:hypothetical protein A671_04485 [Salmonella enterica subsp. enterica serovar Dublin str. DG22]
MRLNIRFTLFCIRQQITPHISPAFVLLVWNRHHTFPLAFISFMVFISLINQS